MNTAKSTIDQLIINSPYEEPQRHWSYDPGTRLFSQIDGRRPAGYVVATQGSKAFDDPGIFIELPLVNQLRPRVRVWREAGYPGATGITRRLLMHWQDLDERQDRRFFFCQLEAIETLIWLTETAAAERRHRYPRRWRIVHAAVRQDGDRVGEDHRDGDADRLAGAE